MKINSIEVFHERENSENRWLFIKPGIQECGTECG